MQIEIIVTTLISLSLTRNSVDNAMPDQIFFLSEEVMIHELEEWLPLSRL